MSEEGPKVWNGVLTREAVADAKERWGSASAPKSLREGMEEGARRMRDWKPPEWFDAPCPTCTMDGWRRGCTVCNGVGRVLMRSRVRR